ncbi:UNVERIFIED_CONTAM: hypothetical protein FKN15_002445 [Acipenser sinensis]
MGRIQDLCVLVRGMIALYVPQYLTATTTTISFEAYLLKTTAEQPACNEKQLYTIRENL